MVNMFNYSWMSYRERGIEMEKIYNESFFIINNICNIINDVNPKDNEIINKIFCHYFNISVDDINFKLYSRMSDYCDIYLLIEANYHDEYVTVKVYIQEETNKIQLGDIYIYDGKATFINIKDMSPNLNT